MLLTVDIGNSRIKAAFWCDDAVIASAAVAYRAEDFTVALKVMRDELYRTAGSSELLGEYDAEADRIDQVFAVCVAGNELRQELSAWVRQQWSIDVGFLATHKRFQHIVNAYEDPAQHGADRWAALVAANRLYPQSALCVICAGTAITIDLLRSDGRHLGGYILPSYASMHAALLADTTDVVSASDMRSKLRAQPDTSMSDQNESWYVVPDNTNDAVNRGIHRLIQAGISDICMHAQAQLLGESDAVAVNDPRGNDMKIIITGGFAPVIATYPEMPDMKHYPDLVMRGLYHIMRQQPPELGG